MSRYGVFAGPYIPGPNAGNVDQKKLCISAIFTQCIDIPSILKKLTKNWVLVSTEMTPDL